MNVVSRGYLLGLWLLAISISGCAGGGFQGGSDVAQGRQAMFRGDYPTALSYFQAAAQANPDYIFGAELREGVFSYLGRAQYLNARGTLQKAVGLHKSDNLARLYLGLTEARQGDQKSATADVDNGLKGMGELLNYIINTFQNTFGSLLVLGSERQPTKGYRGQPGDDRQGQLRLANADRELRKAGNKLRASRGHSDPESATVPRDESALKSLTKIDPAVRRSKS
jgi:tetratricopeptide (TPR) repeat protein